MVARITGVFIISRTCVFAGFLPLSANFFSTSRSVKMPAILFSLSTTATAPTRLAIIRLMASAMVVSGLTLAGTSSQRDRMLIGSLLALVSRPSAAGYAYVGRHYGL